ncbi:MAG: type II toxin-antitoxin system death-on-curing family toxin [Tissierellia bacterium]|nr:type II toxin-antitoxin system death-on-curing family toxin [Tissierellia bacterium]MDD4779790.1 type II toxin-antitoxin system death-on-curing family toxin [Tissierellia bacterium]
MKRLTKFQVIQIHSMLIQETGGIDGIQDDGLLDSALNSPFQSFDGEDIYKTIHAKAARLGFSLINNHAFVDGNKRIGLLVMMTFLEMNGIILECSNEELIELGLGLASNKLDDKDLLDWIIKHS